LWSWETFVALWVWHNLSPITMSNNQIMFKSMEYIISSKKCNFNMKNILYSNEYLLVHKRNGIPFFFPFNFLQLFGRCLYLYSNDWSPRFDLIEILTRKMLIKVLKVLVKMLKLVNLYKKNYVIIAKTRVSFY